MIAWLLSNLGLVGKVWNAIKLPLVGFLENRRGQATGRRKAALEAHERSKENERKADKARRRVDATSGREREQLRRRWTRPN